MYLTRAEGNFEAGTTHGDTPLNDINLVRNRAGASQHGAITQDLIRNERFLELCWEGFRLHDLKRWKLDVYNPDQGATSDLAYNSGRLVLPIPEREMEVNDNLIQNDYYLGN